MTRAVLTLEAAERIAAAVRKVEAGNRDEAPLSFRRVDFARSRPIRMATFTGAWSIDGMKVVTFINKTSTPNTALVSNLLINLPSGGGRNCAIGKEGTSWFLLNWQWDTCHAATAATLTTSALEFKTLMVGALSTSETSVFSVAITTCATAVTE